MAITNSAVHEFDIARFVLDADVTRVQVFRPAAYASDSTGAPVLLVLETTNGQLVNIEVFNNAAYGYDVRGELVCERGLVSLRPPVNSETSHNLAQGFAYPADWRPRFATAYRLQLLEWIKSIHKGKPVGASAWDGYAAALIAEAGLQSLAESRPATLAMEKRPDFYLKAGNRDRMAPR